MRTLCLCANSGLRHVLGVLSCVVVSASILAFPAAKALASSVNLSTGLDATDTLITVGNTPDAHWTVDQPLGGIAPAKVVAPGNTGAAFPAWLANGPSSSWITIDPNSLGNGSVIPYTYYRKFSLTASEAANSTISGFWGIDDGGEVRLNGNLVSTSPGNYSVTVPFSVAAGSPWFNVGANTLTITMTSSDNVWEAVRLEGSLTTVPTPASFLGGAALLGSLFTARQLRRRKA